ncbi:hypothetical protein Godav_016781 [Gossypium davidsonii]|uniref:Uncharacterized protein n=1 Tax=Gossypium davidsonii TaxID=34287 RepID=A0A7J8QSI0_GOSDV|nr:hypothetical protein [Gossypium davidsonii]
MGLQWLPPDHSSRKSKNGKKGNWKAPTTVTSTVGSEKGGIDIEVDTGNGGGDKFDDRSGGGGDGGDNSGGGGDSESKGEGEFSDDGGKKKMALSMSQKLTLGYAALVGVLIQCSTVVIANSPKGSYWWLKPVIRALSIRTLVLLQCKAQKCASLMGGVMGYVKSGSQKSLAAGGLSAAVLYYVYTQLPTNPVFASSVGLGKSHSFYFPCYWHFCVGKGERVRVYWGKKEREIPSKFKFTHQVMILEEIWYICCTFGSDGFPFQEVGKSLSRWGCITRITCDDRGLPAWHHAEYALVKCSGDGNVN